MCNPQKLNALSIPQIIVHFANPCGEIIAFLGSFFELRGINDDFGSFL